MLIFDFLHMHQGYLIKAVQQQLNFLDLTLVGISETLDAKIKTGGNDD